MYLLGLESFHLVKSRRALEGLWAEWSAVEEAIAGLGIKLRSLSTASTKEGVANRHPEFIAGLRKWIDDGKRLRDLARFVEPGPAPSGLLGHETTALADRLVGWEMKLAQGRDRGSIPHRVRRYTEGSAALLDVATGREREAGADDVESWDRLHETWHKALQRARRRAEKTAKLHAAAMAGEAGARERFLEHVVELRKREDELHRAQLPARPVAVAELMSEHASQMPSDEELLFWSAEPVVVADSTGASKKRSDRK